MITKEQKKELKQKFKYIKFHRDGSATIMYSYYWRPRNYDSILNALKDIHPNAFIISSGDHYHDFVGGSETGSSTSSYIWVRFT